jgi:hypothetical protein
LEQENVSALSRDKRGLYDGADRAATIARWLRNPPQFGNVTELALFTWSADEPPEIAARWPLAQATPSLSAEISELIQDSANDCGATISARLCWLAADEKPYGAKTFRARPAKESEEPTRMDGANSALLAQQQKHNEILVRHNIELTRIVVEQSTKGDDRFERVLAMYEKQLERLNERADTAEDLAAELQEDASTAVEIAEKATSQAETARQEAEEAAKESQVGKVVDIMIKQITAGKQ